MGSIVIIGRDDDLCCQLVQQRLLALGRAVLYLPEHDILPGLQVAWRLADGVSDGVVGFGEQSIPFSDIDAVFARFHGFPVSAEDFATKDGQYISAEWHAFLEAWLNSLTCPVMNRLRPELWYKPYLTSLDLRALAPHARFRMPRVFVATRADEARDFYDRCGGRVRYSPLSLPSSYPIRSDDDLAKLIDLAAVLPLHLIEMIVGDGLGVFVMDDSVVSVAADGRLVADTPAPVREMCLEVASALGLRFCQLELVKTAEDEWYCLGANRTPHLVGYQDEVQQAIVERLVTCLTAAPTEAA